MPRRLSLPAACVIAAVAFVVAFRAGAQADDDAGVRARAVSGSAATAITGDAAAGAPAKRVALRTAAPLPALHGLPQRRPNRARRPASTSPRGPAAAPPGP